MKARLSTKESIKSLTFTDLGYLCGEYEYVGLSNRKAYLEHLATKACVGEHPDDVTEFVLKVLKFDEAKVATKKIDPLTEQVFTEMDPDDRKEHVGYPKTGG